MSDIHEWGTKCYFHQQPDVVHQSKLDPRAKEGIVIFPPFTVSDGIEGEYDDPMEPPSAPPAAQNVPLPESSPTSSDSESSSPSPPPESPPVPEPRRSTRNREPSQYQRDIAAGRGAPTNFRRDQGNLPRGMRANVVEVPDDNTAHPTSAVEYALVADVSEAEGLEPRNLAEARRSPDWPQWEKAIRDELAMLEANGTWELVDAPAGANIVGNKWVFRVKRDAAGRIQRYKARLVAQGFSQVEGVDYFDTFAPVARLGSMSKEHI